MSDTLDTLKAALPQPDAAQAELIEKMVAEHKAAEEDEQAERINPFDLIDKGNVKILTEAEADAVSAVIVRADQELENAETLAALMVARAKSKQRRIRGIFENALGAYAREQLKGKKRRSIILEHGVLALRKRPAHCETFCEPDLLNWAELNIPDAVSYKASVSMDRVKGWEAENGKPAPGRIKVDEHETFSVKVPEAKEEA